MLAEVVFMARRGDIWKASTQHSIPDQQRSGCFALIAPYRISRRTLCPRVPQDLGIITLRRLKNASTSNLSEQYHQGTD
jgi:hypothetical protein